MKKVCLIILDGFGIGKHDAGDAVFHAHKEFLDPLFKAKTFSRLKTDGESVGLPDFQCGGSEAGHITIGAGRPVKQFLTIINEDIESGNIMKNRVLVPLFEKAKKKGRIHFLGMLSDGGIHSFQPHLVGLLRMAQAYGIKNPYIHGFLDGRDVGERSAKKYVAELEALKIGTIASLGGRFYAMDRDTNWDRTQKACEVLCEKVTPQEISAITAIDEFYASRTESDYYMPPVLFDKEGAIGEDDIVICFNYRSDRMRQLWSALCGEKFTEFPRPFRINPANAGIFGSYSSVVPQAYTLETPEVPKTLGEIVAEEGLPQLRISETEKFNHVTFYFSGQRTTEFQREERLLIHSPKCASYAEKPEMSAQEQTEALIHHVQHNEYALIVQNFANPDLVGHSGDLIAAEKAISVIDSCLAKEVPVLQKQGYDILIFADHGNADEMIEPDGSPCASHTKNKVPCWLLRADGTNPVLKETGTLADIAPTALFLLGLKQPAEMTGRSLI